MENSFELVLSLNTLGLKLFIHPDPPRIPLPKGDFEKALPPWEGGRQGDRA
jgi:hypothetical protein